MGKKRKERETQIAERAAELREGARELAETGGKAFDEFAHTTGSAAKDFAQTSYDAARHFLETVEQAGERLNKRTKPSRRRGRKVLKATVAVGAGAALLANEKVRGFLGRQIARFGGGGADTWGEPPNGIQGDGGGGARETQTTP